MAECAHHAVIIRDIGAHADELDDHEHRIRSLEDDRRLMTAEVSRSAARYSMIGSVLGAMVAGAATLIVALTTRGGA